MDNNEEQAKESLRLFGIQKESIVDGPGLRYAIFAQGCLHGCPFCHNPASHPMDGGYTKNIQEIIEDISKNPLLQGVTFSGGDPLEQSQIFGLLGERIQERNLDVWCYTGYTFEELMKNKNPSHLFLLHHIDILVDGPYMKEKRTLDIPFIGSSNQRIIKVKESLESEKIQILG